jgi:acyl-[acyl-carrier-protein]-phospholipid O-acyltransferase / long-chain-fatty-acid--[acyl-carrier-protein] ligase
MTENASHSILDSSVQLNVPGATSMNDSGSYSDVLKVKGIQPFLWMQLLNAFNDNVYKLVVSLLAIEVAGKERSGVYLSIAGLVFIAPFLPFSGYAGQLADKFEKRSVVIVTKAIEIAAMLLALFALRSGSIQWMLVVLFFTATQAAIFSPAKYGIVPELVSSRHLARANGLLEMSTFVAIILGTIGGSYLVGVWHHESTYIGLFLIAVALLGTLVSLRVRHTPAPEMQRRWSWNPFGDVLKGMSRLAGDRTLWLAVSGQYVLLVSGRTVSDVNSSFCR